MNYIIKTYKIPILLSITLSVVLIAIATIKTPLMIVLTFLACLLGIVVNQLDFIIEALFNETETPYSKNLKAYLKHNDIIGALKYNDSHWQESTEKTIESALFQILFAVFCIFVVYSNVNIIIKALALSIFANNIYKFIEVYFTKNIDDFVRYWIIQLWS